MLFNSYIFLLGFLPITLIAFYGIGSRGHPRLATGLLVVASFVYYGWWNPSYIALIAASIGFNYGVGLVLADAGRPHRRALLVVGVTANLGLLGWYKYANFFVDNVDALTGVGWNLAAILLPLAISFFTFQQIAYLVDAYRGETREYDFLHYCLFVTFFPQLIAGPIVHHREMLPQFEQSETYRLEPQRMCVGLTIFFAGLFKKVVIADTLALHVGPVFDAAAGGVSPSAALAWSGALAYTFQLYFDFSGYSDMAIGLARMFGIRLPLNFNSPYKSTSVIDFWRRWHMTLARFLRDYLYIPLGGNRRGTTRRYVNVAITMLLGGLWHGAGWTFVIWGALHGFFLIVNHGWRALRERVGVARPAAGVAGRVLAGGITFLAVVVGWVFFRAPTAASALVLVKAMIGMGAAHAIPGTAPRFDLALPLALWVWLLPNVEQMLARFQPALGTYEDEIGEGWARILEWRPTRVWAMASAVCAVWAILMLTRQSEFLYFQF